MGTKAGEVHSIRLPAGKARELEELTGQKVSTFCRTVVLSTIERIKLEKERGSTRTVRGSGGDQCKQADA